MSVLNVYAVRDLRMGAYLKPVFLQNDSVLTRALQDALKDENSLFSWHPEDYQVFRLGAYDDGDGTLDVHAPEHMFNLIDIQEPQQ